MFRDEIIQLLQETTPDWMAHGHGLYDQDDITVSEPTSWDDPVKDEYPDPQYSEEVGIDATRFPLPSESEMIADLQDSGMNVSITGSGGGSAGRLSGGATPVISPGGATWDPLTGQRLDPNTLQPIADGAGPAPTNIFDVMGASTGSDGG